MVHLMEAYRAILLSGVSPEPLGLLFLVLPALALLYLGYHVFKRASGHFVDEL
jgi:ABC-type polysaccharide/polyol phosphate export permease